MTTSRSTALKVFHAICWFGMGIWVTTIFVLSSLSGPEIESYDIARVVNDKILHFIAYSCGIMPLVPGLRLSFGWPLKKVFWCAVACISLHGALDELHQKWTPSRSGLDPWDWLADTVGAFAGGSLAVYVYAFCERKLAPPPTGN